MTTRDHTSAAPEATLSRTPHAGARASGGTGSGDPLAAPGVADALRVLLRALAPANVVEPPPRWRTIALEASRRGMPPRALRDLCRRYNVPVRGTHKHQLVDVAALDAIVDAMPADDTVADLVERTTKGAR